MKKLLCAGMLALVPAFSAYAAEEQQQASANRNLAQECRAHTENGRMLRSMPDYLREDCAKLANRDRNQQPQEQQRQQANEKKKRDQNANQSSAKKRDAKQASQDRNNRDARNENQASESANERNAREASNLDANRANNEQRREENR